MSRLLSAEVLINSHATLIFIAKILLKLFFCDLLHPIKLKARRMVLSNDKVFKITLVPQWTYFLLVRKIRPFSPEKVVITQSDACRWFCAPVYAKWLPLNRDITVTRHPCFVYLSVSLRLGLFMFRLCDLFFHYHFHFHYN